MTAVSRVSSRRCHSGAEYASYVRVGASGACGRHVRSLDSASLRACRVARTRSSTIAPRIRAPTTARCQKSSMPEAGQRPVDGDEQERADGRAPHGAAAAEDRDAADHGRRDGLQLDAAADARAHRAVARGVEGAGEPGQRAAEDERGEQATAYGQPVEDRGVRVGPDGVELAAAAGGVEVVADRGQDDHGDDGQHRDAEDRAGAEPQELAGQVAGVDPVAARPGQHDPAVDVEGAERDHERRHLAVRHQQSVDQAEDRAEQQAGGDHRHDRQARVVDEEAAGEVGGERHHRADRQVDVAGDDHDALADGQQHQDRRVQQEVAPAVGAEEEAVVLAGREHDDRDQDQEDRQLAGAEDRGERAPGRGEPAGLDEQRLAGGDLDVGCAVSFIVRPRGGGWRRA